MDIQTMVIIIRRQLTLMDRHIMIRIMIIIVSQKLHEFRYNVKKSLKSLFKDDSHSHGDSHHDHHHDSHSHGDSHGNHHDSHGHAGYPAHGDSHGHGHSGSGSGSGEGFSSSGSSESGEPAKYEFEYDVAEGSVEFGHKEQRDGDYTTGTYYVLLPDGRRQVFIKHKLKRKNTH